jgi:oxaloacetate decarboxylase gamma subunit
MDVNLFGEGLNLLVLGMGFVFTFLVFLVFVMSGASRLLARFEPEPKLSTVSIKPHQRAQSLAEDNQLIAVLASAIHTHRKNTMAHQ